MPQDADKPPKMCLKKQLRKTKMCQHFETNACKFGAECAFAHSPDELSNTPNLTKTKICQAFAKGACNKADCGFAHGESELRSTEQFFKKTLCIWNEKGECRAGELCRFAHGLSELKASTENDNESSVGSVGHPSSCAAPCKYFGKPRGCKDGSKCARCHLCPWTRGQTMRAAKNGKKRSQEDQDSDEEEERMNLAKRRRTQHETDFNEDLLDEKGNSCPCWLQEERRQQRRYARDAQTTAGLASWFRPPPYISGMR